MNMLKLNRVVQSDKISIDDWNVYEYDSLKDLNFENDGIYSMSFEHEETILGKEKYLKINVHRLSSGDWILSYSTQKQGDFRKYKVKNFKTLINTVHKIFSKF